jgi:tetratricopeptide (TPR) repeat protein
MIQEHPWFGVGPGAFPVALLHYQELPYVSGENPHNLYVEIAAEYGIAAGVLVSVGVLVFLARATAATRQLSAADPVRGRRTALLAALVAFGVHSATDLDWSYPAVSLLCAVILGLVSSGLPERPAWRTRQPARWRAAVLIVLACASIVALTRYYGATFVAWGRDALSAGNVGEAAQYLRYARALNPTSFSAHAWLARTELRTGNPAGALETAQRTIRIAPADPNTHALAGEMALAAGRWRQAHLHFQSAVERGPASHLWFHGALLDAAAAMKDPTEAKRVYARAGSVFTDDRVLGGEARCLAPGDRYLLARMSRVFADLARRHGMSAEYKAAEARAGVLAQPDLRGICGRGGQPGQTSPEAVVASYWRAVSDAGWAAGERYLLPARRRGGNEASPPEAARSEGGRFRLAWVYSLSGGERRAAVVHQTAAENGSPDGDACARAVAMFTPEGWYLEDAPRRDRVPCRP